MKTLIIIAIGICISGYSYIEFSNPYLSILGDPRTGGFLIKTIRGNPHLNTDHYSFLLYNDTPPGNFATIKIDEKYYNFGSDEGEFLIRYKITNKILLSIWSIHDIEIRQIFSFANIVSTEFEDGIVLTYIIKNNDSLKHSITLRVLLDTYLGEARNFHFILPNGFFIRGEKEYKKKLPKYIISQDKENEPEKRFVIITSRKPFTIPKKIVLANWKKLSENWNAKIEEGHSFKTSWFGITDSAIGIYYPKTEIKPKQKIEISLGMSLLVPTKIIYSKMKKKTTKTTTITTTTTTTTTTISSIAITTKPTVSTTSTTTKKEQIVPDQAFEPSLTYIQGEKEENIGFQEPSEEAYSKYLKTKNKQQKTKKDKEKLKKQIKLNEAKKAITSITKYQKEIEIKNQKIFKLKEILREINSIFYTKNIKELSISNIIKKIKEINK